MSSGPQQRHQQPSSPHPPMWLPHSPFRAVLHGLKMAAKEPAAIESQREVREQGTKGLLLDVLAFDQGGDIFTEASNRLPLRPHEPP